MIMKSTLLISKIAFLLSLSISTSNVFVDVLVMVHAFDNTTENNNIMETRQSRQSQQRQRQRRLFSQTEPCVLVLEHRQYYDPDDLEATTTAVATAARTATTQQSQQQKPTQSFMSTTNNDVSNVFQASTTTTPTTTTTRGSSEYKCRLQGRDVQDSSRYIVSLSGIAQDELKRRYHHQQEQQQEQQGSGQLTTIQVSRARIDADRGIMMIPSGASIQYGSMDHSSIRSQNQQYQEDQDRNLRNRKLCHHDDHMDNDQSSQSSHSYYSINQTITTNLQTVDNNYNYDYEHHHHQQQHDRHHRALLYSGIRSVLVVRVEANDFSTTSSAEEISNAVFGTDGVDAINLKERYNSCSYGYLQMEPYSGTTMTGVTIPSSPATAGTITVTINRNVNKVSDDTIRDAVIAKVESKVGDLASQFDHVLLCLPPNTKGSWVGYAYVNDHLSVYNDAVCNSPSVQMHEVGHNLELDHSNEGKVEYGDRTCMMGISYGSNEGPKMCFNPSKSWQMGWYSDKRKTINGLNNGPETITLVGVDDYQSAGTNEKVMIKIVGNSGGVDYYIGYNRATGINAGVKEYAGKVLVYTKKGSGYGTSKVPGKLSPGDTYSIKNYKGTGDRLVISADSISGGKAVVTISRVGTQETVFFDGFEDGFDQFTDGGDGAFIQKNVVYKGNKALALVHNQRSSRVTSSTSYSVSAYQTVKFKFRYRSSRANTFSDKFIVFYKSDLSSKWIRARVFNFGKAWPSNNKWYEAKVKVDTSNMNTIRFRIKASFSDSLERIFVDNTFLVGIF